MGRRIEVEARFINVDLDVEGPDDLAPLVEALGADIDDLYTGPVEDRFATHLELGFAWRVQGSNGKCGPENPEAAICGFAALIAGLPPEARRLWDGATTRDFNIGIAAGTRPRSVEFAVSVETLALVVALRARVAVTVYAVDFEYELFKKRQRIRQGG